MAKAEITTKGAPCWADLMSSDTDKSREFYGALFGWNGLEANEEFGGYFTYVKGDANVAGCMPAMAEHAPMPNVWTVYLKVDDAQAATDAVDANGGSVLMSTTEIGDLGGMAIVADPGGGVIGLWEPKEFSGFDVIGEASAPVWFELQTRDYDKVIPFYREVFKWNAETFSDTDEFRYTTLNDKDTQHAGIMDAAGFLPEGVPAYWSVYFQVPDADAAVKRVAELGGSVLREPQDTPYGRLATVTDSNGAAFNLMGRSEG